MGEDAKLFIGQGIRIMVGDKPVGFAKEGMRVTGKMTMPVNDYGEYLARTGKRHHNILRRKRLMKAS